MSAPTSIRSINLPVVDFSKATEEDSPELRKNETAKLIEAFTQFGFAMVENIEGYNEAELYEWIKWLYYDVSSEDRFNQLAIREFNPKNPNVYRGIFPLIHGKLSHKEGYDLGEDFQWETSEEKAARANNPLLCDTPKLTFSDDRQKKAEQFYEVLDRHRKILQNVGDNLMSMIAEAGGETSEYFSDMFQNHPLHTLRTIMYPQRKDNIPESAYLPDGRIVSTPAHQDSGFLTLLQTFGYPGLEILLGDEWLSVQVETFPRPGGTLVVNVGELLSTMSNERFKATIHRVVDIGQDRFSMPFFYEPNLDANIYCKIPKPLLPPESIADFPVHDDVPYGSFLLNKLPIYTEWSKLIEMLPEWMIEKYLNQRKVKVSNWASKNQIEIDGISYDDKLKQSS